MQAFVRAKQWQPGIDFLSGATVASEVRVYLAELYRAVGRRQEAMQTCEGLLAETDAAGATYGHAWMVRLLLLLEMDLLTFRCEHQSPPFGADSVHFLRLSAARIRASVSARGAYGPAHFVSEALAAAPRTGEL